MHNTIVSNAKRFMAYQMLVPPGQNKTADNPDEIVKLVNEQHQNNVLKKLSSAVNTSGRKKSKAYALLQMINCDTFLYHAATGTGAFMYFLFLTASLPKNNTTGKM